MHALDAQEYLDSFTNFETRLPHLNPQTFNLQRVRRLFSALGDPQKNLKFIHVAGSKGKGSTCAFAAYILRAAGYRVGLYTSPHLYRIHERIRVLEPGASASELKQDFFGAIDDRALNALVRKFRRPIDRIRHDAKLGSLTYFEVLTGLALCHFARRKTDIVVLETGLGGRLDATNAVEAAVSGIAPISFDHMAQLGNTLSKIAAEKAAIIKDRRGKVVVGQQPAAAMKVIQSSCRAMRIKPWTVGKDIRFKLLGSSAVSQTFEVTTPQTHYRGLRTDLRGRHQLHNAAMAIGMIELLAGSGFNVGKKAVAAGIRSVRWPARFETIKKDPTVIIDCAHNTASAENLAGSVREMFPQKDIILILGLSNDKDVAGVCRILGKDARLVVTTQSRHPRAYHFSDGELKKLFRNKPAWNAKSVTDALTAAHRQSGKKDLILVAGSIFIAAEARALLKS